MYNYCIYSFNGIGWHFNFIIFAIFIYSGGQGRRRFNLVPPESEGYCGSTIRSATGGGKTMLYIVPLQDEFDLSPLPSDAQEFSQMPKAECKKCSKSMPRQILALHVRECNTAEYETLSDSEPEVRSVVLINLVSIL